MGVGPALPWGRATPGQLSRGARCRRFAGAAPCWPLVGFWRSASATPWTLVTLAFGGYALQVTLLRAVAAGAASA